MNENSAGERSECGAGARACALSIANGHRRRRSCRQQAQEGEELQTAGRDSKQRAAPQRKSDRPPVPSTAERPCGGDQQGSAQALPGLPSDGG